MKKFYCYKLNAMTIVEMLTVLVIVSVLVMLAMPDYSKTIGQAKALEAKVNLNKLQLDQKMYRYQYNKYADDINDLTFIQRKLATEGGTANYKITILEASVSSFVAQAEAVIDFDGDGEMNIWQVNHEGVIKEIQKD